VTTKSDNISRATSRVPLGTEDELSSMEIQVRSHKHYHHYWRQEDILFKHVACDGYKVKGKGQYNKVTEY
jgi:hypothetical protein